MSEAGSVKSEPAQSAGNGRVTSPGQTSTGAAVGGGGVNKRSDKPDDGESGQRMIFSGKNAANKAIFTL